MKQRNTLNFDYALILTNIILMTLFSILPPEFALAINKRKKKKTS